MTLRVIEGFDHYTAAQATAKFWAPVSTETMIAGRLAGQAMRLSSGIVQISRPVSGFSGTTLICGFAYRQINAFPVTNKFLFGFGGTAWIGLGSARQLLIMDKTATVVTTGTTVLNLGEWYYIEFKLALAGASGTCAVHLNGLAEIAAATGDYGSSQPNTWTLAPTDGVSAASDYDDVYMLDGAGSTNNNFLGDCRVETLLPNGDGANTAWTPNSGTAHFSRVNQLVPDDDTSYVSDATPGDRDTYTVPPLSIVTGTVYGVQTNLYARKDDAATRTIAPVIREAATNYDGTTTLGLSTAYAYYTQCYDQDPTGSNWTIATVNANEYGVKEIV